MTGDEDDRNVDAHLGQLVVNFESADARKPHVQDQAARTIRVLAAEELLRGREALGSQPHRFQQTLDRRTYAGVVVDDEHGGGAGRGHGRASTSLGRVKWNVAPGPELAAAHKRPPCDSMIDRLIGSPIPVPLGLVVKNALKIWSACWGGNPTPVSLTEMSSWPPAACSDRMVRSPVAFASFMASMPLSMRFMSTCCSCTRSALTLGSPVPRSARIGTAYRVASVRSSTIIS